MTDHFHLPTGRCFLIYLPLTFPFSHDFLWWFGTSQGSDWVSFSSFFSRWRNLSCFPSEHASVGFGRKYWMFLLECSRQGNVWLQQHWESLTWAGAMMRIRSHLGSHLWIIQHSALFAESSFFVLCRLAYQTSKHICHLRHRTHPTCTSPRMQL